MCLVYLYLILSSVTNTKLLYLKSRTQQEATHGPLYKQDFLWRWPAGYLTILFSNSFFYFWTFTKVSLFIFLFFWSVFKELENRLICVRNNSGQLFCLLHDLPTLLISSIINVILLYIYIQVQSICVHWFFVYRGKWEVSWGHLCQYPINSSLPKAWNAPNTFPRGLQSTLSPVFSLAQNMAMMLLIQF